MTATHAFAIGEVYYLHARYGDAHPLHAGEPYSRRAEVRYLSPLRVLVGQPGGETRGRIWSVTPDELHAEPCGPVVAW